MLLDEQITEASLPGVIVQSSFYIVYIGFWDDKLTTAAHYILLSAILGSVLLSTILDNPR